MDAERFDTLTRVFVSRRAGIGLTLASLLGIAAPAADAKKKRKKKKCKPKCGACATCKKGKCKPIAGQKPCGVGCIASEACCTDGVPGCPWASTCTRGACVQCVLQPCAFDAQCCTGLCSGGQCLCLNAGDTCANDAQCCNSSCSTVTGTCACEPPGGVCDANEDCCSGTCSFGDCL